MGYRYIGAKTKVIQEVLTKTAELVDPGAHVVDLMCGTGAVAIAYRRAGYRVTANDVMTYSYHHARVGLLFTSVPTFKGAKSFIDKYANKNGSDLFQPSAYHQILDALGSVHPRRGYFWCEFSPSGSPRNTLKPRNYFSPENSERIDAAREWIRKLHENHDVNDLEHSLLIHDLIMSVNDIANIAGTYGHYLSRTVERAKIPLRFTPTPLLLMPDEGRHHVLHGYAESIAKDLSCDLCYIDPPYMKRQYAANYHVLETLAREDEPTAIGVSGLRPWRDQYSNFCTKTRIQDSFRAIIANMRCPNFLVSYSEDGLLSLKQMSQLLREFGKVKVTKFSNKRFRSNNSRLNSTLTEYLIYLQKD